MRGQKPLHFWILIASLLVAPRVTFAEPQTENLNPGPRSSDEAVFLFQEASDASAKKDHKLAIKDFERFLDRYPGDEKANSAYISLMESELAAKKFPDVVRHGKELLNRKPDAPSRNRANTMMAEANLNLKNFLDAKLVSDELLKGEPTDRQKATAYSVKFQCHLEDKQFPEADSMLDALTSLIQKAPMDPFSRLLPEYRMILDERKCTISHLLKNKQFNIVEADNDEDKTRFTEEELMDYFSKKNLCMKSALPATLTVTNPEVIHEWCEAFTNLNHELERLRIDPFLKQKISKDLKATFDFSKTLSPDLSKCYAPIKVKKRRRKRRVHTS